MFPRGFFARGRPRLGHAGRCRGSNHAAPPAPTLERGLEVGIYDGFSVVYRDIPALLEMWRIASRQEVATGGIPSGTCSLTSRPPGTSVEMPAPPSWGPYVQATVNSRSKTGFARPAHICLPGCDDEWSRHRPLRQLISYNFNGGDEVADTAPWILLGRAGC